MPLNLIDFNDIIICPNCRDFIKVRECHYDTYGYTGNGHCENCSTVSIYEDLGSVPLDVQFQYDIVRDEVAIRAGGQLRTYKLEYLTDMCSDCIRSQIGSEKVYVTTRGEGENYHIVQIYSMKEPAQELVARNPNVKMLEMDCPGRPLGEKSFPVYVISVGEGAQYRIVEICMDRKRANKVATSIRGSISMLKAVVRNENSDVVHLFKYFVVLEENYSDDRVFYVDRFPRRVNRYSDEPVKPFATLRRRYNSSLPFRLEVAGVDRDTVAEIAEDVYKNYSREEIVATFGYNEDYQMVNIDGKWKVEPCLLEAARDE